MARANCIEEFEVVDDDVVDGDHDSVQKQWDQKIDGDEDKAGPSTKHQINVSETKKGKGSRKYTLEDLGETSDTAFLSPFNPADDEALSAHSDLPPLQPVKTRQRFISKLNPMNWGKQRSAVGPMDVRRDSQISLVERTRNFRRDSKMHENLQGEVKQMFRTYSYAIGGGIKSVSSKIKANKTQLRASDMKKEENKLLLNIANILRAFKLRILNNDREQEVRNEWQQVAMVLDKFAFVVSFIVSLGMFFSMSSFYFTNPSGLKRAVFGDAGVIPDDDDEFIDEF